MDKRGKKRKASQWDDEDSDFSDGESFSPKKEKGEKSERKHKDIKSPKLSKNHHGNNKHYNDDYYQPSPSNKNQNEKNGKEKVEKVKSKATLMKEAKQAAVAERQRGERAVFEQFKPTLIEIMNSIITHKYAAPFSYPVDPVRDNAPDYLQRVKRPMDFGTIQMKMDTSYTTATEFVEDMRLVFLNCWIYNHPTSELARQARVLSALFEKQWLPLQPQHEQLIEEHSSKEMADQLEDLRAEHQKLLSELSMLVSAPPQEVQQPQTTNKRNGRKKENNNDEYLPPYEEQLQLQLQQQQLQLEQMQAQFNSQETQPQQSQQTQQSQPPPLEEFDSEFGLLRKQKLGEAMGQLTEEWLSAMVESCLQDLSTQGGEIELDLDKLPAGVLMKLENFIRTKTSIPI